MRTTGDFISLIEKMRKKVKRSHSPIYGANVMPMVKLFEELIEPDERSAYLGALEAMLQDPDEQTRKFALDLCIAFVVFKDVPR